MLNFVKRRTLLTAASITVVTVMLIMTLLHALATPSPTSAVSIDIGGATHATTLTLGTNLQSGADIIPDTGPRGAADLAALTAWNPPQIRLHLGFLSSGPNDPIVLPDAVAGQWDFTAMDTLLGRLRTAHLPVFLNVRTAPPWMFDQTTGQLPDSQFANFANYMVDLVDWYNKGGLTINGKFVASGHYDWIHAWEIWNEPKSGWDIPAPVACRSCAPWMTAPRYAHLYDVVSVAMRAADPSIAVGGPAINSWPDMPYLQTFMADATSKLDFFSLHFYGATSAQEPDQLVFASIYGPRFYQRLVALRTFVPASIPLWVDELNINEASTPTDIDPRGTSPVIYPFLAASLTTALQQGVALVDQFNLVSDEQFGLVNISTNAITRPYWLCKLFSAEFPPGSQMLHIAVPGGVSILAVINPVGTELRILMGNVTAQTTTDVNGPGLLQILNFALSGTVQGRHIDTTHKSTMWTFDATSPIVAMPTPVAVGLHSVPGGATLSVALPGDSAIVLSIPLA